MRVQTNKCVRNVEIVSLINMEVKENMTGVMGIEVRTTDVMGKEWDFSWFAEKDSLEFEDISVYRRVVEKMMARIRAEILSKGYFNFDQSFSEIYLWVKEQEGEDKA